MRNWKLIVLGWIALSGAFQNKRPRVKGSVNYVDIEFRTKALSVFESSGQVFEPQLSPAQPLALVIMMGFGVVQLRLNRANSMADEVELIKDQIKDLEVAQLDGEAGIKEASMQSRIELEKQRDRMSEEIENLRCLIAIGDTKVNFRAPQTARQVTERRQEEAQGEGEGPGTREIVRVVVGVGIILLLANLLSMLATDPVTSVQF